MKITEKQIRKVIREEVTRFIKESRSVDDKIEFWRNVKVGDKVKYHGKPKNGFKTGGTYEVDNFTKSSTMDKKITIKNGGKKLTVTATRQLSPVNESINEADIKVDPSNLKKAMILLHKKGLTPHRKDNSTIVINSDNINRAKNYLKDKGLIESINESRYLKQNHVYFPEMDKLSSSELNLLDKSIEKVDTVIDTDPQYETIFEQWFELGQEIYDIDDLVDSYRNLQHIIEDEGERNSKLNKLVSGIVKILDKL